MRTVIVGVGRMGRRHIKVVKNLGLHLVGICDPSDESLRLANKEHGVPAENHYKDMNTMFEKTQPEIVIIATTAPTHCDYTCKAAECGAKYILCEKPMAVSLAECDQMLETCNQNGTQLAINHQMRFMEQYTKPKTIINSQAFGGLSSVTVVCGNFGMSMNGLHYFEMFHYMTDELPDKVSAWLSKDPLSNPRGVQFEDHAGSIRLITASGKRFYMEIGADQGHGMLVVYTGSHGRLVVDELAGKMDLVVREEQFRDLPTTRYGMPWIETSIKIEPAEVIAPSMAVLKSLLEGNNPPTGEDGRLAISVLVGAYESHEHNHTPIQIDEHLPRQRVFPWA